MILILVCVLMVWGSIVGNGRVTVHPPIGKTIVRSCFGTRLVMHALSKLMDDHNQINIHRIYTFETTSYSPSLAVHCI